MNTDNEVRSFLKKEFNKLLKNKIFDEALLGHIEQDDQINRKDRIINVLKRFTTN